MRIVPMNISLYRAVLAADEDYRAHGQPPYFGFTSLWDFSSWLLMLRVHKRGDDLPPGWSPYEIQAMIDDDGAICAIGQLRRGDCRDNLTWLGHIGYSVPPGKRRRGYATQYLSLALQDAFSRGWDHILLTCDIDNIASKTVIERCGGLYCGQYHDENYHKLKYWFYPDEKTRAYYEKNPPQIEE